MAWKIKGNANKSNNRGSKGSTGNKSSGSSSGSSSGGSRGSGSSGGSSGALTASGASGSYNVGSSKGKNFINNAAAGSTMTGGDGSKWTKNADGSTTITKDGKTYNYGGSSSSGSSSGGSLYRGGNKSYNDINKALKNNHTTTTPDWLKQAQANSQAWHTADAATRKELERKNQALYGSHGYTYNASTGKWTAPSSGISSSGLSGLGSLIGTAAKAGTGVANQLKQVQQTNASTDYGKTFWQAALNGATADDLQKYASDRLSKAQSDPTLAKYVNDQKQHVMQAYINRLREMEDLPNKYNSYYENALQQTQDYYDRAAQQAAEQYRQIIPTMNQSYDEAARQAYINYRTAQRDLPSQLAAAGISGQGAAESSLISQNNAYNSAYNQNELARQQALANLENQAANAYNNMANQGAQSVSDILLQQANTQQNILQQQEQMRQNAIGNLYNYAGLTGGYTGNGTLAGKELAENTAYNNKLLEMQQQQAKADQENAMRNYYLQLWEAMGTRGADSRIAAMLGIPVGTVYGAGTYNPKYY